MPNSETERLLKSIGSLLAEDTEYPLDGTLLYAAVGNNSVRPSIFKDGGDQVIYRSPDLDSIAPALLDLWEAENPDERWAEIEYFVRDGVFEAAYTYADEIDPDEDWNEQRKRVLERYYGRRPIVYPSRSRADDGLRFKL